MSTKNFIIKIVVTVVIFIVISTLLRFPIISNNVAMGQMENSNTAFVLMEEHNKIASIVDTIYYGVVVIFVGVIAYDIYDFIKFKEKN